jgi:hypothetical protein
MSIEFYWLAVTAVTVMSAARITRLLTFDEFPPMKWIRDRYDDLTGESDWNLLFHCPYCMGFWVALGVILWGYLSGFDTAWWLGNGVFAGAYLAAIVMVHDGDE